MKSWAAVTDDELMLMSSKNPELRFERNADGTIVTMQPTGGISGNREIKAGAYLFSWVDIAFPVLMKCIGAGRMPTLQEIDNLTCISLDLETL